MEANHETAASADFAGRPGHTSGPSGRGTSGFYSQLLPALSADAPHHPADGTGSVSGPSRGYLGRTGLVCKVSDHGSSHSDRDGGRPGGEAFCGAHQRICAPRSDASGQPGTAGKARGRCATSTNRPSCPGGTEALEAGVSQDGNSPDARQG
jgi:hypothetical protein